MREQYYQRRLISDLEIWVKQGKISEKNAEDIVNDLPNTGLTERLPTIIAILGAVLISFGILAFVAANWHGVSKITRLGLIAAGMWTSYGIAGALYKRGYLWLFEAAVLLGVSIYASGIVLIAQMYHMDGHYPDAIFMAGAGALVAAFLVRSISAMVISFGMLTLWTHLEIFEFNTLFHWPFIIAWCFQAAVAYQLKSHKGYHLATLSLGFWTIATLLRQTEAHDLTLGGPVALFAAVSFLVLTVSFIFSRDIHKEFPDNYAISLSHYAISTLAVLLFLLQITEAKSIFTTSAKTDGQTIEFYLFVISAVLIGLGSIVSIIWRQKAEYTLVELSGLIFVGVASLIFSIVDVNAMIIMIPLAISLILISLWMIDWGQNCLDRYFVNLGFILFGAEVLYIYFETFGTLMNSFIFFTLGGIILIALAFGLDRFRKRILHTQDKEGGEL